MVGIGRGQGAYLALSTFPFLCSLFLPLCLVPVESSQHATLIGSQAIGVSLLRSAQAQGF